MAGKKSKGKSKEDPNARTVCQNRRARHNYEIEEELECGIVLYGSEVKAIRDNKISIDEAYARMENGELWLLNVDIAEYPQATYLNHERRRARKLLLSKRELRKFAEVASHSGMSLVPLSVYFTRGLVKVKIGAGKGRKVYDKRDRIKGEADRRVMRDAVRKRS
ncbi:UNVERIFIED_CONTAM: hypothetical protein GTU68_024242 [Idotea baltica]|nr:hypothetical protein [Idotea baltica]